MNNWKEDCFQRICVLATGATWVCECEVFIPSYSLVVLLKDIHNPISSEPKAGLKYLVVWEDFWFHSKEKILALLQSIIGKNQRVYARNTQIQQVDKKEAQCFLEQYHLLNSCKAQYHFGLRYKGNLLALASFSKPKKFTYQNQMIHSFELSRYVCASGITVVGGLSRLIRYFVEMQRPCHLMTYVDCEWSDGKNFEKIGFECVAQTAPIVFFVDKKTFQRVPVKNKAEFATNSAYIISNLGNHKFSAYFT